MRTTIFPLQMLLSLILASTLPAALGWAETTPAFPGAEGYGRFAQGGRGGDVYHVTTREDNVPGSMRHGIDTAKGPRTIVFDVAGTFELKSGLRIEKANLTIAGQSAPREGVTLKDYGLLIRNSTDVVIRYIRIRLGDKNKPIPSGPDGISLNDSNRIILDHVSASWAIDGIQDTRRIKNYTLQWSIFSEALNNSIHDKGEHAMCASFRAPLTNITVHHNIFTTCRDRHPTIGGSVVDPQWIIDFRNNVIYNWTGAANVCDNQVNLINNYFRPGPESNRKRLPVAMKASLPDKAHGHMSGNYFDGRPDLTENNYAAVDFERWLGPDSGYKYAGTVEDWKVDEPYDLGDNTPVTQSATEAFEIVLAHSGASQFRDAVDHRVIGDIRNRTGKLIDSQDAVGGWPELVTDPAPVDTDQDGMADEWEKANGLDPKKSEDRNGDLDGDGYTNLEEYLNGLCVGFPAE